MKTFELQNSHLVVQIEELGARIASVVDRSTGSELLHRTQWESSSRVGALEDGSFWPQRFANGWNVLIPHAGDERTVDGIVHPYHGEAARRRWRISCDGIGRACASVTLESLPLFVTRTVSVIEESVRVTQEVRNIGDSEVSFAWVEHPVFDADIFAEGAAMRFGRSHIALAPPGSTRFAQASGAHGEWVADTAAKDRRVHMTWERAIFPFAYVWQERGGTSGAPWYGLVNGVGIEPATHPAGLYADGLGPLSLSPGEALSASIALSLPRVF